MSILVYTESENNNFKKNALEVLSYGKALSKVINEKVICVSFNIDNTDALSSYGADKSIIINDKSLLDFKAKTYSSCISHIAKKEKSKVVWDIELEDVLELWDKQMKKCVKKIAPLFNRAVIFSTDDTSYHGHPDPLNCPETVSYTHLTLPTNREV